MTEPPRLDGASWLHEAGLRRVFAAISDAGGEARVAGGAVRNTLMHEPVADIDVATTLLPDDVMKAGEAAGLGVHPTGLDHGTVTLTFAGKPYEVTTLRIDTETFGRKARVDFTTDWQRDARRRDFTVNALYCDAEGNIHDYVDGYRDILRKRIRFIDDAEARIKEDYLRILRFFRFHARYGAGSPDAEGLKASIKLRQGLDNLSAERLHQELFKLLVAPRALPVVRVMAKNRILSHVFPHVSDFRAFSRMTRVDAMYALRPDALCRLFLLAADARQLRSRLRLSNEEAGRIAAMGRVTGLSPRLRDNEQRAMLYRLGADTWQDAVRVAWAQARSNAANEGWLQLLRLPERWTIPKIPVHGRDVMEQGIPAGPQVGELLQRLEDWWIASDFKPDKAELLANVPAFRSSP